MTTPSKSAMETATKIQRYLGHSGLARLHHTKKIATLIDDGNKPLVEAADKLGKLVCILEMSAEQQAALSKLSQALASHKPGKE